jgi:hypothetical protein
MSTETELRHTVTLTESDRLLMVELLNREWTSCDDARGQLYNVQGFLLALRGGQEEDLLRRQSRVEAILRKLGYLG